MRVMKFGGTSVGDPDRLRALVEIVRGRRRHRPVLVVSALSGITDLLLGAAAKARATRGVSPRGLARMVAAFRTRHRRMLEALELNVALVDDLADELERTLSGIALLRELTPRIRDLVASFGERASVRVVAAALEAGGIPAVPLDAGAIGLCTDDRHGAARPLPEYRIKVRRALAGVKEVPVITGFLGRTRQGAITTLGRGGSDYSASLIGAALDAKKVEIWTDVDGVYTADPRVVPQARPIDVLTFAEAAELAYFGAKVLHPATLRPALEQGIPVHVLNTFRPEAPGTHIVDEPRAPEPDRPVTGMAWKPDQTLITARSARMLGAPGFLAALFAPFSEAGLEIDMVATSEVSVSFTMGEHQHDHRLRGVLRHLRRDTRFHPQFEIAGARTVICLVGRRLRAAYGVAAAAFAAVQEAGATIEMISQGASRVNFAFVVENAKALAVIRALHARFFEAPPAPAPVDRLSACPAPVEGANGIDPANGAPSC